MIKTYTSRHGTYTSDKFLKYIDKTKVKTIVEGGSRDLIDALFLEEYFNGAYIHSFECNREAHQICLSNLQRSLGRITLNSTAMCNEDAQLKFYAFDHIATEHHDIGVSSIYRHINPIDVPQKEIEVTGIRLDTYCNINNIQQIDFLCLDVQGAEQIVLEGLGDMINKLTYLVVENDSMFYSDAPTINQALLEDFRIVDTICNDALYIRK